MGKRTEQWSNHQSVVTVRHPAQTMSFESLLREGATLPFSGWNFESMRGRWERGAPPWDLRTLLRDRFRSALSFVDLGTGGGEFLASLGTLPRTTVATEGYPPNLPIARARLEPLGVRVIPIGGDLRVDLPSGTVDLVHSRHEAFDPREVARLLRHGGTFITQQVGGRNYLELRRRFGEGAEPARNRVDTIEEFTKEVREAGFNIEVSREATFPEGFRDVGAVVYFLRAAPWEVPDFSLEKYRSVLEGIHEEIVRNGRWQLTAHRLLVVANRG